MLAFFPVNQSNPPNDKGNQSGFLWRVGGLEQTSLLLTFSNFILTTITFQLNNKYSLLLLVYNHIFNTTTILTKIISVSRDLENLYVSRLFFFSLCSTSFPLIFFIYASINNIVRNYCADQSPDQR